MGCMTHEHLELFMTIENKILMKLHNNIIINAVGENLNYYLNYYNI